MDTRDVHELLEKVRDGLVSPEDAAGQLRIAAVSDLGYAQVDNLRGLRQGVSEVIYGAGKTSEQIAGICRAMREAGQRRILITRLGEDKFAALPAELKSRITPWHGWVLRAACASLTAMVRWLLRAAARVICPLRKRPR